MIPNPSHSEWLQFNLLGDPAVDLGDRVIYRDMCDLVISPDDISGVRYPTRSVNSSSTVSPVYVTVRNIGAIQSGTYTVALAISQEGIMPQLYTISGCSPLKPGACTTHRFDWEVPEDIQVPVVIQFHASVSGAGKESWMGNNDATVSSTIIDFYPNNPG